MSKELLRPLKVSITGIDGAGKSTVTDLTALSLGQDSRIARISRPTYSIVRGQKTMHYEKLLRGVDRLHAIADQMEDITLICGVNALNVVLQGRVIEPGLIRKIRPNLVLGSRDYLIDPSVYAIFYTRRFSRRDMESRLSRLQIISGLDFRDVIFFLTVPPDEAVARIDRRISLEKSDPTKPLREKWRHMHEKSEHLGRLQCEYNEALEVARKRSGTQIIEIDTTRHTQDETASLITDKLKDLLNERS